MMNLTKIDKLKILEKILENLLFGAFCGGSNSAQYRGALSSVDLVSVLFNKFLGLIQKNFNELNRNYFILSKGHACLVYWCRFM